MTDLSVQLHGLTLPNPFIIASGPPGTNANVIAKAFDEGWGAVVAKTVCLDAGRIENVTPRYARWRDQATRQVLGWENIELISDRPFEAWLEEFRAIKRAYPGRVLIASIMEECRRGAWEEIVSRVAETGVDGLELNLSCPHGLPEQRMGSAMGQDPEIVRDVCGWVRGATDLPVWAKLTPNITSITDAARAAFEGGASGVSTINTILSTMGVDLQTLRPLPTVEGYSTPGGYSGQAVRPIALRMSMECARLAGEAFPGRSVSGIGGVESGEDAAQYLLLGASSVQVCTGVMVHGYRLIHALKQGLSAFMERHGFTSIDQFRGHALQYMTTHADLVARQKSAKTRVGAGVGAGGGTEQVVRQDGQWRSDQFVQQSERLISG